MSSRDTAIIPTYGPRGAERRHIQLFRNSIAEYRELETASLLRRWLSAIFCAKS